jgi:hypothetical protein
MIIPGSINVSLIMRGRSMFRLYPVVLLLTAAMVLSSCMTSWVSFRQRLTIVVETPTGEVSGSSVTEVLYTRTTGPIVPMEARGVIKSVTGEAVVVEVAPGRYLFALLSRPLSIQGDWQRDATSWVYPAYNLADAGSHAASMRLLRSQPYDVPVPLPPEGWPIMVTFADIADPTSVARVDPDNLAASFGPGVRIKAVTLEITRASVTTGTAQSALPWLCDYTTVYRRLSGESSISVPWVDNPFPNQLAARNFLIGECT